MIHRTLTQRGIDMDGKTFATVRRIYQMIDQANDEMLQVWQNEIVFTWRWWLEIALSIIPWVLWFFYRKRESTGRLLCTGFLVVIISSWFDFLGTTIGLWYYPVKLIPTVPSYIVYDFTLMPVIVMSLLQVRPEINAFVKGCLFAGVTAFVGEPVFEWLHFYNPVHWKHIYSFPIYLAIYLIANYVSHIKSYMDL